MKMNRFALLALVGSVLASALMMGCGGGSDSNDATGPATSSNSGGGPGGNSGAGNSGAGSTNSASNKTP